MTGAITWEVLFAFLTVLGSLGAVWKWLHKVLSEMRQESARGRERLYERMDVMMAHMDANFVRKDVYNADMRVVQQALEENATLVTALAQKTRCPHSP